MNIKFVPHNCLCAYMSVHISTLLYDLVLMLFQGGKPGTGKLYTDVFCSAHTSGAWSMALGLRQYIEYYEIVHNPA